MNKLTPTTALATKPRQPMTKLAQHIADLKAKKAASPTAKQADDALLFWGTGADENFLHSLKPCVGGASVFIRLEPVITLATIKMYCRSKGITRIVSTSITLLRKLLDWDKKKAPSLADYSGSYFTLSGMSTKDPEIEIVFIQPLKQLVTVPFGKFMATRIITKLTKPNTWLEPTEFTGFDMITPANEAELFREMFFFSSLICIDIETFQENAVIRCLSYTSFYLEDRQWKSKSVVLALDSEYALAIMRKWNWELKAPKIMQNGKYDIAYFARYSAPCYNYLYDTAMLFHCWYAELPKDLGFLNSFFVRKSVYHKDLAQTNDLQEYYRYNALDTWSTGNCFLAMVLEAPTYALDNYRIEFPLTFPCHLSEMTGIARDMSTFSKAVADQEAIITKHSKSLNTILGIPEGEVFNVKSSPQKKALFKLLGCVDLKSTDAKNMEKAKYRHPFNMRILNLVSKITKARDLLSKYLTPGKEFTRMDGTGHRALYSLNPHGTDTSRLASKSHHFWCGANIQNIPRGPIVKQTFKADPGFRLFEVDLEQAESRDTGYISGDAQLIENVENSPDFHCSNASCFFGVPFEEMYDIVAGKVLNKPLRQLGKPVNHGANYNMGAYVLIDTMGEKSIVLAKKLLKLPRFWSFIQVAEYLLEQFHKTYPNIKGVFYKGVVKEVLTTSKLTSTAVHHSWMNLPVLTNPDVNTAETHKAMLADNPAWTRYCFGDPSKSKPQLNAYIAHPPQSLNAQTLNKAYLSVFHDIANNPKHSRNFKLLSQVHDSILGQYRTGHEYLVDMVTERMEIPLTVKAYDGIVRTFVVPAGAKRGQHLDKGYAEYWSETE